MGRDAMQIAGAAFHREIEAPVPIHPRLPKIDGGVILLCPQGRMTWILKKQVDLLVEGLNSRVNRLKYSTFI